jgi:hypothetical protein
MLIAPTAMMRARACLMMIAAAARTSVTVVTIRHAPFIAMSITVAIDVLVLAGRNRRGGNAIALGTCQPPWHVLLVITVMIFDHPSRSNIRTIGDSVFQNREQVVGTADEMNSAGRFGHLVVCYLPLFFLLHAVLFEEEFVAKAKVRVITDLHPCTIPMA